MKRPQIRAVLVAVLLVAALRPDVMAAGLNPIGQQRQFFFDDAIVETLENTRRKLNPALKLADNPVIKRDKRVAVRAYSPILKSRTSHLRTSECKSGAGRVDLP